MSRRRKVLREREREQHLGDGHLQIIEERQRWQMTALKRHKHQVELVIQASPATSVTCNRAAKQNLLAPDQLGARDIVPPKFEGTEVRTFKGEKGNNGSIRYCYYGTEQVPPVQIS